MVLSLAILLVFNVLYEALIVAYTIAVADRKRLIASILSAVIEPVKLVSLILVVESMNKWLAVAVVSLACGVGNYFTLSAICKLDHKRKPRQSRKLDTFKGAT